MDTPHRARRGAASGCLAVWRRSTAHRTLEVHTGGDGGTRWPVPDAAGATPIGVGVGVAVGVGVGVGVGVWLMRQEVRGCNAPRSTAWRRFTTTSHM